MLFSEKIKKLRKSFDLTQEALADKLNVSRQAITKWESGEGIPDIENLKNISNLFNTTIDELIKEEKTISENINKNKIVKELEIDHIKDYDINITECYELNFLSNKEETVKVELVSSLDNLEESFQINFDNIYNKLDIDIKSKKEFNDLIINIYLPVKYINNIEISAKMKELNINDLIFNSIEYDGTLKYLNVNKSKGKIVLNTTKCDIEACFDHLDGEININTFNSVSRLSIDKNDTYRAVLKGIKNEFVDSESTENSNNIIELNGLNSKLIILKH